MPKEILLYGQIYDETSMLFIQALQEANEAGEDIKVRVNCIGGEPEYGWGMVAKFKECTGNKSVIVDGMAHSMGMFFLCYADKGEVESYDVAEFLIHRCAYSPWFESSEYFTDAIKANLERVNKSLMTALSNKIDIEAFENLKQVKERGIKFKDIFNLETRHDVYISAADAKKIGLVDRVIKLTPLKAAEINSIAEKTVSSKFKKAAVADPIIETQTEKANKIMTIEKLKAEHPEVFAAAVKVGVEQENDRVKSCLVFQEIDPAGVKLAIESGKALSETQKAEFALKAMSKKDVKAIETTNTEVVKTAAELETEAKAAEKIKKENDFLREAGLKK